MYRMRVNQGTKLRRVFSFFFFSSLTNIIKSECVCVCVIQKCEHMYSIPYKENRAHVCHGNVSSGYKYFVWLCSTTLKCPMGPCGVNRFSHTCTYMDTSTNTSYVYICIYSYSVFLLERANFYIVHSFHTGGVFLEKRTSYSLRAAI